MGPNMKQELLKKKSDKGKIAHCDLENCITTFKKEIKVGPYFTCSFCDRLLYRKSVSLLQTDKYDCIYLFTKTTSFDGKENI